MRALQKIIILAALTLIFFSIGYGAIKQAKYAGEFLSTGVGARALGMGGTYVALPGDVTSAYWNPAALVHIDYPQLIGMHAQRFSNIVNYNYAGIASPFGEKSSLALSFFRIGVDDIADTRQSLLDYGKDGLPNTGDLGEGNGQLDEFERLDPNRVVYFNSADYALFLSYGKQRSETFSYGGNVKMIKKGVGDNSAWGIGFDIACLWRPVSRLNVGLNLQDITTTLLVWDTGRKEAITPTSKVGAAYIWDATFLAGQFIPAFDIDVRFENRKYASNYNMGGVSFDFHGGMEYRFKEMISLRLGSDLGNFTAGIGIKLPKLNVDYAFLSHNDLGDTHRISLLLILEEERFRRK